MQPETLFLIQTVALAVMFAGLIGLIIPIFPGLLVIWLSILGYGIATGFQWWSALIFVIITLLAIAGSVVDNVLIGAKALQKGASWLSLGIATVAGIAGSLMFPPFGGCRQRSWPCLSSNIPATGIGRRRFSLPKAWRRAGESRSSFASPSGWS